MPRQPIQNSPDGTPIPVPAQATGYQLGWSHGAWVVIRGNAGSQCQTHAESQALADQLNHSVGITPQHSK